MGSSAEAPGLAPLRPSRLGVVQTCRGRSQAQALGGQVEPSLGKTATPSSSGASQSDLDACQQEKIDFP